MRFDVKISHVGGALVAPLGNATRDWDHREGLLLELSQNGVTGLGEASPLPGVSPESLEEAHHVLQVAAAMLDVDSNGGADAILDTIADMIAIEAPAARFALETAALDWLGKSTGRAVHHLLGRTEARRLPIAALVDSEPEAWDEEVGRAVAAGYEVVKLKVGRAWPVELDALERVRARHPSLALRLDANRSLSPDQLIDATDRLVAAQVEFFEEPVATRDLERALRLSIPIAIDESLQQLDRTDLQQLLEFDALQVLVLKPTVLGGLGRCRELARSAADHGRRVAVSHALEGPVAHAAAAELALSLTTSAAPGLGAHAGLSCWPPVHGAAFDGASVRTHPQAGLGLPKLEVRDA